MFLMVCRLIRKSRTFQIPQESHVLTEKTDGRQFIVVQFNESKHSVLGDYSLKACSVFKSLSQESTARIQNAHSTRTGRDVR